MAKTVDELIISLKAKGLGSVTALKSALRSLGQSSATSDKQLEELKKEILEVASAGQNSRQSIKGQADALKALRDQATLGGNAFKKFSKDVAEYEARLKAVDAQIESTGKKIKSLRQIETQFTGRTVEGVEKQIAARRQLLDTLKPLTAEYAKQLGSIKALEQGVSRSIARQQVVANAQMRATVNFATGPSVTGGPSAFAASLTQGLGPLPNTISALNLRIGELKDELKDLDFTSEDYRQTQARILELEKQLKTATDSRTQSVIDQERRLKKLDETEERRARRAAKVAGIQAALSGNRGDTLEIGSRDSRTGAIIGKGTAPVRTVIPTQVREISSLYRSIGDIGMSGISADIDRMGRSYEEVTRDIQNAALASNRSVNSLQAQRASWSQLRAGLSPTSKAYQDVGREIEKVDRQLEKLNRRRRRPTVRGLAQGLGGVAAGGVFGGPEGALGAAVGGAVGGIAGVAAGAALGAQAKMLREALGATANYAAELKKLEIALEGVTEVQDKFGNKDVISSLGNYQAGLKAASDVTRDFNIPLDVSTKGITRLGAAVIGAGGNITDAEVVFRNITSAIKATGGGAQDVDSAITAMVQTFSKGKVSAEELSGQLGERLPGAVTQFAEANNMTLPELQKAFKAGTVGLDELMKFIISLGPRYEETARAIADSSADAGAKAKVAFDQVRREVGEALQPIGASLQEAFAEFVLEILPGIKAAAVTAASGLKILMNSMAVLVQNIKEFALIAGAGGLVAVLLNLKNIVFALKVAVFDLRLAFAALSKTMLLNPFVALAAGITAATIAIVKYSKKNQEFNKSVIAGETTNKEASDRLREMNDKVAELEGRLEREGNGRMIRQLNNQLVAAKIAADNLSLAMKLASSYEVTGIKYDRMTGLPINAPSSFTPTDYEDPKTENDGSAAGMTAIELSLRRQMREAMLNENELRKINLQYQLDMVAASHEFEDTNKRINMEEEAANKRDLALKKSIEQQTGKIVEDMLKEMELNEKKKSALAEIHLITGDITKEQYEQIKITEQAKKLTELFPDLFEEVKKKLEESATPLGQFKKGLREIFEEAINLKDALATQGVQAVQTLGDTFADFVATGKADFADMTASILQDLARIFAKAALFKGLSLIPGVGNFLGGGGGGGTGLNLAGIDAYMNAKGNIYAKNKIVPFAYGGIVNKPTIFPMAKGAGILGEAGPEAIMPLRRGSNGKLGVEASGGVGNVVVNVDASGSKVQGDQPNAKALGSAIGAAVQAELVRQKRPGGLLS